MSRVIMDKHLEMRAASAGSERKKDAFPAPLNVFDLEEV